MNRQIVGTLVAGLAFAALYASPASADLVFSFDSSTSLGAGSYGTVTLAQEAAGVIEITVDLSSGVGFVTTGAGGKSAFLFDVSGNPTITETVFNSTNFAAGGTSSGASIHADGSGNWQYSVLCPGCANGGSSPNLGPLSFDVTATTGPALTINSFPGNGTGFFAADICTVVDPTNDTCDTGNTGVVYAAGPGVPVPEPMTLALFGAGLLGIGALGGITRRAKSRAS